MQTETKEKSFTYQRRRPELTPCYPIFAEELDKFLADRQTEGRPVPDYLAEEFEAYLKCGIFSHGFMRLQCESCQKEKIVAFSCKKRGFCPSCCAKRMAEAATHLTEHVLPMAPYRQFMVSFPVVLTCGVHRACWSHWCRRRERTSSAGPVFSPLTRHFVKRSP